MLSIKNYLKVGVSVWLLSMTLIAQTNDSVNAFYNESWAVAWNKIGKSYYNNKDHIVFINDDVVLARLKVFKHYFWSHPHSNRFHDLMLELETDKVDLGIKLDNSRKRNRKTFFKGLGIGAGIVLAGAITIKILQ